VLVVASERETRLTGLLEVLDSVDHQLRSAAAPDIRTMPSGFPVLDGVLGGGLHVGELVLLGGAPGVGKTIMALQIARNVARAGGRTLFACFEHEPTVLFSRLLSLEAGEIGQSETLAPSLLDALAGRSGRAGSLADALADIPLGGEALARLESYHENFTFIEASGSRTTTDALAAVVRERAEREVHTVVFVDYLQKIPLHPEPETEAEKVTRTVEALKDLAMEERVTVVLLSAIDTGGMQANRVRIHHLRGSTAAAFEADVVLMLNEKQHAISKVHLTYDSVRARTFRNYLVVSVEKNRGGPNLVDLEFRKDYAHFRVDPDGSYVVDRLIDERLDEARV
jgi:replicative DNA helicase